MKNLEILAPAGNLENLKVAISNGANAVYLGLQSFNARNKADNFTTENIKDVTRYCHLRGVKVYLTVNTIVKNDEFDELIEMVEQCIDAKVDAYIVQDLGVAHVLRNTFKNINLHASTQMGVHNLMGAKLLEKLGFSRVVLSRETTIEDIKQISQNTNLEIEYFVQGALCVAFSGNCYLSSLCHSESGNRGRCLQLCRLKYRSFQNDKQIASGYLLSPTDLCLIDKLKQLKDAGVTSLKIEGRMRRAGYVGAVVSEYKKAINYIEYTKDSFKKSFYRGKYNEGLYLTDKNPNIINKEYQNHRGVEIGVVKNVKPFKNLNEVIVLSNHKLTQNDGVKFVGAKEISLGVGSVKDMGNNTYSLITTAKPEIGDKVYLTVDKSWEDSLTQIKDKLKIKATFSAHIGKKAKLEFGFEDSVASVESDSVVEKAQNSPLSRDSIEQSISKLGDTNFELEAFECDIEDIFMPKSIINDLRRKAAEKLSNEILDNYVLDNIKDIEKMPFEIKKTEGKKLSFLVINEESVFDENADVIISPKDYNDIPAIKKALSKAKGKRYLNLPIIANAKDMEVLNKLTDAIDFDGVVANNIYGLSYPAKDTIGGFGLNIANSYTVDFLASCGVESFIKSIEDYLSKDLGGGNVYTGKIPLMTLCHCPFKVNYGGDCSKCKYSDGLVYRQESGKEFEIRRYKLNNCYFELLGKTKADSGDIIDLR